jgi:hypothetical protein
MDSSAVGFQTFGPLGCSYCQSAKRRLEEVRATRPMDVARLVQEIKSKALNARYDCIIGVSGGVDSSWLLQWAVSQGLRVLAVHMDNCWNTSQASLNISRLIQYLGCDLYTHVLSWNLERDARLAFMNADVVDVELLYDNSLHKVCFEVAHKFGVKYILGGQNNASEGVEIPPNWAWKKFDGTNIRDILKRSGVNHASIPILTSAQWLSYLYVQRISWVNLLDLLPDFSKESALELLTGEFGFVPYGNKHYENVFTRFYQGCILPEKFGFDKRRPHLSSQIVAGEISREKALEVLNSSTYPSASLLAIDRQMVKSKLGLTESDLEHYLKRPARPHTEFKTDKLLANVVPALLHLRRWITQALRAVRNAFG